MAAKTATLQAHMSQVTQQLFQSSQHETELALSEQAFRENCEALKKEVSALQESRDKAHHRANSLVTELAAGHNQLREVLTG